MRRGRITNTIFRLRQATKRPARGFMEARSGKIGLAARVVRQVEQSREGALLRRRAAGASTHGGVVAAVAVHRVARRARRVVEELLEEAVRPRQAHGGLDRSFYSLRRDELVSR